MSPVEPAVQNPEASSPPTGEGSPSLSEGTPEQAAPLPEPVEKVRKIYVRDLREKERIQTVFRVSKKSRHVSRNGKIFLAVSLADKTGEIDSRIFDQAEDYETKFAVDDFVLVTGEVISFHGRPQVLIKGLDRLEPEPIDPAEFAAPKDEASKPV